jgi:signal recognition particle receptor subunit beta
VETRQDLQKQDPQDDLKVTVVVSLLGPVEIKARTKEELREKLIELRRTLEW